MPEEIDVIKATTLVKEYFQNIYGNLGLLLFKIESVNPNTEANVWVVYCNFFTSLGASKRTRYKVRVNIQTGKIVDVNEVE